MDVIVVGADGTRGASGGGFGGHAGAGGAGQTALARVANLTTLTVSPSTLYLNSRGGLGGTGGNGGGGDGSTNQGRGGDGGAAGQSGDSIAEVVQSSFTTVTGLTLIAVCQAAGQAGQGGSAANVNAVAGPGGAGANSGTARVSILETAFYGIDNITLTAQGSYSSTGASGGVVGNSNTTAGTALAEIAGSVFTMRGQFTLLMSAYGGGGLNGADTFSAIPPGAGANAGAAVASLRNSIFAGTSGDSTVDIAIRAVAALGGVGGRGSNGVLGANGLNGQATVAMTGNTFDLGAGNDNLTFNFTFKAGDSLTITGNILRGGEGYDVLTFTRDQDNTPGPGFTFNYADQAEVSGFELVRGGAGNDTIRAGAGNDTIDGMDGNDFMDGGAGIDTLVLSLGNGSVTSNVGGGFIVRMMAGTTIGVGAGAGNDTFVNFENVAGSSTEDDIEGDAGANQLEGGGGIDLLAGLGGNDTLLGQAGDDTLNGGEGNDSLAGGSENDRLNGGTGNDTALGEGGNDVLTGAEGNDTLIGGDVSNRYSSIAVFTGFRSDFYLPDDDVLIGGDGADTLIGGAGADTLTGGAGADVFLYRSILGPVSASTSSLARAEQSLIQESTAQVQDMISDFETGTDRIDLTAINPVSISVARLAGGGSVVFAESPRGNLVSQGNSQAYQSGAFQLFAAGASVNGSDFTYGGSFGVYIIGSSDADTILGGSLADPLVGNGGDDTITGGGGADAIAGGAGRDIFRYLSQSDSNQTTGFDNLYDFTSGEDRIDLTLLNASSISILRTDNGSSFIYAETAAGVFLTTAANRTVQATDITFGSGPGGVGAFGIYMVGSGVNDVLVGTRLADPIAGGGGNDTITGGGGADAMFGDGGADTFVYLSASDSTAAAADGIFGFVSGTDRLDLRAVRTGAADTFGIAYLSGGSYLFVDLGGNGTSDLVIGLAGTTLVASDIPWNSGAIGEEPGVKASGPEVLPVGDGGDLFDGEMSFELSQMTGRWMLDLEGARGFHGQDWYL